MNWSNEHHRPGKGLVSELDNLIQEALLEAVEAAEPSSLVWARIRAEIEADRVSVWVAWWRRLRLACVSRLPHLLSNATIVALFLLLVGLGLREYSFFDYATPVTAPNFTGNAQRQIATAERRFYDHYRVVNYYAPPPDVPPREWRRSASPPSARPVGPQHLIEAANPL